MKFAALRFAPSLTLCLACLCSCVLPATAVASEPTSEAASAPLVTNDAVVAGMLMVILGVIFWTSSQPAFRPFYKWVPMLLLCYFVPSLLTLFGIVDPHQSRLYHVASRYLLPASLVLLTISIDLGEVIKLGPKAVIMFLTGTAGVVFGGPLAVWLVACVWPEGVGGEGADAVWRGLATVAGSWIGGGANQTAMKETFQPSASLFSVMVAVDVIIAEVWMMFLLLGVGKAAEIDRLLGADASSVTRLQQKMEDFSTRTAKIPTATDLMVLLAFAFGITGAAHWAADLIAPAIDQLKEPFLVLNLGDLTLSLRWQDFSLHKTFVWLIVLATTGGLLLSFTPARRLEGVGASRVGTVFIFVLVATIGLGMDISALFKQPGLFAVGGLWMLIHVGLLFLVAYFIKAPYFFLAVGSKANIGGAASAPVVAAAFHPSLAPVGVLLATLGYALGTYGALFCARLMEWVAPT